MKLFSTCGLIFPPPFHIIEKIPNTTRDDSEDTCYDL